ncbi:hypothetical protein [Andreprevotia chitinilytica]|uniref:hypothetical protein n=1 Tax=Andreprevotia chitinilytica TaxID=396808 RepID=UPI000554DB94|nr:hypothetical protein [Andreprevotia chitinilytica]
MDIKLNFVNQSNDANNATIVIFQKNVSTDFDGLSVAWKVIRNCGRGDNHPFIFPIPMFVGASDSWGDHTPQIAAENGQLYGIFQTASGTTLSPLGPATSSRQVQVRNNLTKGGINTSIYKAGKLLATKANIAPGKTAVFEFKPTIWIGVVAQAVEGQVMNPADLSKSITELSLLGIASADIVMTGGGSGPSATPHRFTLENIVMP